MEIPTLRAWVIGVDERRPANGKRLSYFVHVIHGREGRTCRRNILAGWMANREHPCHVLLPAALHDAMFAARRSKRRLRAVGAETRRLDIGVRSRLVVV